MKTYMVIIVTALLVFMATTARADVDTSAKVAKSLEQWNPIKIGASDGVVTVVTKERRVTKEIYLAMVGTGLCFGLFINPNSLDGVKEVRFLNQFERQGYVFMGGKAECEQMESIPLSRRELFVLGFTRMHTN